MYALHRRLSQQERFFNRMAGAMRYLTADNRDFLLALLRGLEGYG